MRAGDKSSLALLSSKRTKAYSRTQADEAFALPSFSDVIPDATTDPQQHRPDRSRSHAEHGLASRSKQLEENMAVETQRYDTMAASEPGDPINVGIVEDTQDVRQTMLQHESVFKEQLSELHRLYQKQCWLMAESKQNGAACHPHPEPPSSNSSPFSSNIVHEERSLGDAGVTKSVCKQDPLSRSVLAEPWVLRSKKQGQQESRPVLNNEPSAIASRPILNLELPGEAYLDIEQKAMGVGGMCKGSQEKRTGNSELSLLTGYEVRMSSGCKEMNSSSNEKTFKGYSGQSGFFQDQYQETGKMAFFPLQPLEYNPQESTLGLVRADEPPSCRTEATHKEGLPLKVGLEPSRPWAVPGWLSQQKDKQTLQKMHGLRSHSSQLSSDYGERKTSSATQELFCPLLQNRTSSQQGNFPREIFCAADNMTRNVGLPPLSSGGLTTYIRNTQGMELHTPPEELFTRVRPVASMTPATVLPWYLQSTFHSQQPEPKPSGQRLPGVSQFISEHKLHQWESACENMHPLLISTSSLNSLETGFYGMHKFDINELGVTLNHSMKGNGTPKLEEVEKPFCLGQIFQQNGEKCGLPDLNSQMNDSDLNVSVSPGLAEEDGSHAFSCKQNSGSVNGEGLRQEHGTDGLSLGCMGTRAPPFFEQQSTIPSNEETTPAGIDNDTFCMQMAMKGGSFCSQVDVHANGACTSIEGEMGERLVGGKASDGSGLTSCESRDVTPTKATDHSNMSSGEACQSRESRSLWHEEDDDVALSSNSQLRVNADKALLDDDVSGIGGRSQQSTVENASSIARHELKRMRFADRQTDFDESEAANSTSKRHSVDMAEAAELLLSLGSDRPSLDRERKNIHGGARDWFADIIGREEMPRVVDLAGGDMGMATGEGPSEKHHTMGDTFESAVVMLKLVDPDSECLAKNGSDGGETVGRCFRSPHLQRGLSGGVKVGTKELRRGALSSLSRQEISEDLEIMEGMINSHSIRKQTGEACASWGESIRRRKQRGRRRSRWMSLPLPVVQV